MAEEENQPVHAFQALERSIMKKILILCTGNSCRSQMAEGYLRFFAGRRANIFSAGIETHGLNAQAVATMLEDGIDISSHTSNAIAEYSSMEFDDVITVCDHAKEMCPVFPGRANLFHQNFPDPSKTVGSGEEIAASFRHTRDLIKQFCREWAQRHLP